MALLTQRLADTYEGLAGGNLATQNGYAQAQGAATHTVIVVDTSSKLDGVNSVSFTNDGSADVFSAVEKSVTARVATEPWQLFFWCKVLAGATNGFGQGVEWSQGSINGALGNIGLQILVGRNSGTGKVDMTVTDNAGVTAFPSLAGVVLGNTFKMLTAVAPQVGGLSNYTISVSTDADFAIYSPVASGTVLSGKDLFDHFGYVCSAGTFVSSQVFFDDQYEFVLGSRTPVALGVRPNRIARTVPGSASLTNNNQTVDFQIQIVEATTNQNSPGTSLRTIKNSPVAILMPDVDGKHRILDQLIDAEMKAYDREQRLTQFNVGGHELGN